MLRIGKVCLALEGDLKKFGKRVALSFVRGFLSVFIPGIITELGNVVNYHHLTLTYIGLMALLVASVSAGLRAIQGMFVKVESGEPLVKKKS
jgi:hypothetical protein